MRKSNTVCEYLTNKPPDVCQKKIFLSLFFEVGHDPNCLEKGALTEAGSFHLVLEEGEV